MKSKYLMSSRLQNHDGYQEVKRKFIDDKS
jgi:hypothetical protein